MPDEPTYEIVGEIERFDERDTVFSREALVPGSPEEIEYHRRNPDLAEVDHQLSKFIISKMDGGEDVDQLARAVYESHFIPPAALALPDMVDGTPGPSRIEWDREAASVRIKAFARQLGADDVRIGPLRQEWVYSHKGSRPFSGMSTSIRLISAASRRITGGGSTGTPWSSTTRQPYLSLSGRTGR